MAKVKLTTTTSTFHDLHEVADNHKRIVRVERQALINLLLDHTLLINAVGAHNVSAPSPPKLRERIK